MYLRVDFSLCSRNDYIVYFWLLLLSLVILNRPLAAVTFTFPGPGENTTDVWSVYEDIRTGSRSAVRWNRWGSGDAAALVNTHRPPAAAASDGERPYVELKALWRCRRWLNTGSSDENVARVTMWRRLIHMEPRKEEEGGRKTHWCIYDHQISSPGRLPCFMNMH